jgi:hypothetical protein
MTVSTGSLGVQELNIPGGPAMGIPVNSLQDINLIHVFF